MRRHVTPYVASVAAFASLGAASCGFPTIGFGPALDGGGTPATLDAEATGEGDASVLDGAARADRDAAVATTGTSASSSATSRTESGSASTATASTSRATSAAGETSGSSSTQAMGATSAPTQTTTVTTSMATTTITATSTQVMTSSTTAGPPPPMCMCAAGQSLYPSNVATCTLVGNGSNASCSPSGFVGVDPGCMNSGVFITCTPLMQHGMGTGMDMSDKKVTDCSASTSVEVQRCH